MSPALIEFFTRPQFINVATPTVDGSQRFLAGIRARGGTIILHNGAEVNAAPDADPGTKFARITETARIVYAPTKITGTVTDLTVDGSGGQSWLARERAVTPDGASAAVIASNVVTLAYADMNLIDTEGSAAADNLDGVILPTDLVVGDVFPIRTANDGRDITIRHNRTPAGAEKRIFTPAGIHFTLSDTDDVAYGTWDGTRLVITSVILTTNANGSSSKGFGSRSVMVAYAAIVTPQVGTVWTAAGLSYRYIGTGTAIADMAGWVPDGRVYADHYNQNITPGTTDMAAAALAAADYVGNNGGGKVLFGPENYRFAEPVDISNVGVWFEGDGYVATNTDAGQTRIIIDHDLGPGIRFSAFSHGLINIVVSGSAARAAAGLLGSNGEPNYGILIEAPDVSGGAGYIQRGLIRNVTVRGQPNDLIVTAGENSGTTFENVAAIYGGRHGFVFSNGLHTGRTNLRPPGICILSNCRATDLEGHALAAGDPADSGLSAYRLTILQFEYFRCGADPSLLHEPAGIFLMGQNHKIIQSAGGEAGQAFACVAGRNNDIDNCRLFGTSAMAPILVREYPNDSTRGINVINPSLLPTSGIYPVIVDIGAGCQEVSVTVKHDQRGNNTTYADVVTPGYGGTQVNSSDLFSISTPMEAESFRSGPEVSIADDAVYAYEFSPGTTSHGVLLFHGNSDGTIYGMFVFRAAASGSYITPMLPSGSNTDAVLTALTGTTGTNGRFTVGVTQDAIYFENRRGGARSIVLTFLSGNFRKEYLT